MATDRYVGSRRLAKFVADDASSVPVRRANGRAARSAKRETE
jgi:hypothetical protein